MNLFEKTRQQRAKTANEFTKKFQQVTHRSTFCQITPFDNENLKTKGWSHLPLIAERMETPNRYWYFKQRHSNQTSEVICDEGMALVGLSELENSINKWGNIIGKSYNTQAVFGFKIDLDSPIGLKKFTLDECADLIKEQRLRPALLIESSPGRFHVVFLFQDPIGGGVRSLAEAYTKELGGDPSNLASGYLNFRLPGSIHIDTGHIVKHRWLIHHNEDLPLGAELWEDIHGEWDTSRTIEYVTRYYEFKTGTKNCYQELQFKYMILPDQSYSEIPCIQRVWGKGVINKPWFKKVYSSFKLVDCPSFLNTYSNNCNPTPDETTDITKIKRPYKGDLPYDVRCLSNHRCWERFLRAVIVAPHLDTEGAISTKALAKFIGTNAMQVSRFIRLLAQNGHLTLVKEAIKNISARRYRALGSILRLHRAYYGKSMKESKMGHDDVISQLQESYPLVSGEINGNLPYWYNRLRYCGLDHNNAVEVILANNQTSWNQKKVESSCSKYQDGYRQSKL